jgi:hypothetical protein
VAFLLAFTDLTDKHEPTLDPPDAFKSDIGWPVCFFETLENSPLLPTALN